MPEQSLVPQLRRLPHIVLIDKNKLQKVCAEGLSLIEESESLSYVMVGQGNRTSGCQYQEDLMISDREHFQQGKFVEFLEL